MQPFEWLKMELWINKYEGTKFAPFFSLQPAFKRHGCRLTRGSMNVGCLLQMWAWHMLDLHECGQGTMNVRLWRACPAQTQRVCLFLFCTSYPQNLSRAFSNILVSIFTNEQCNNIDFSISNPTEQSKFPRVSYEK